MRQPAEGTRADQPHHGGHEGPGSPFGDADSAGGRVDGEAEVGGAEVYSCARIVDGVACPFGDETSLDLSHELPADLFRHHARSQKGHHTPGTPPESPDRDCSPYRIVACCASAAA